MAWVPWNLTARLKRGWANGAFVVAFAIPSKEVRPLRETGSDPIGSDPTSSDPTGSDPTSSDPGAGSVGWA